MQRLVRNILLLIVLSCLAFGQPAQALSKTNMSLVDESTISAIDYTSTVDVAQIISPTTFPIHEERKADSAFLVIQEIVFQVKRTPYLFQAVSNTTESAGFLNVRKYQSSYLPKYV